MSVRILLCTFLIVFSAPALAQENATYTLPQVLAHSFATNPDLAAARSTLRIAQEEVDRARSGWRPTISAYGDATTANIDTDSNAYSGQDGTEKSLGLAVSQPLYRGGTTTASVRGAKARLEAGRATLQRAEQSLLLSAATVYMDVVEARELRDLAASSRDVLARERKAASARFSLGDVTKTDVSQAEARLARAEADLIRASGFLETSQAAFTQVTGLPLGAQDILAPAPPDLLADILPKDLETARTLARTTSPRVKEAQGSYEAAQYGVRAVQGELLPQIALNAGVNHAYDPIGFDVDERTNSSVGVRATIPLYEAGETRARLRESRHEVTRAGDVLSAERRAAERQAVEAWTIWVAAKAAAKARAEEVRAQGVAQEGVRREADLGGRTILDVLNAQQEYLDSKAALVSAKRAEVLARFALASFLGLLTPPKAP